MLKVEVIGNIGADAEKKNGNGGEFIAFRVASTFKYKTQDGKEVENTDWIDVTLSNPDSKVIPFLKRGEKVFVRGTARLRVYSSPKDRCMKAGLTIMAQEIELVGGIRDDVPRELVVPEDGTLTKVSKYYMCDINTAKWKKDESHELYDRQGNLYQVVKGGWVAPVQEPDQAAENATQEGETKAE